MLFDHSRRRILGVYSSDIIIMVITIEKRLDAVPSQQHRILPHLLLIVILPVTVCIFCVEVILIWGHKRRGDFPVYQVIPVEAFEPYMLLDFLRTVKSETVNRFSLDQTVNEVRSFERPPRRDLIFTDLNLLREDVIPNLFPCLTDIRSLSVHAFVTNNAHCEVVYSNTMILPTHDFRSHITGSS